MKKNFNVKRKGFTLVELLIVIVVIGVLSAMMMLSSTEAVSSAKASNVVSNLRNLKTAALAFYVDSMDECEKSNFDLSKQKDNIMKYMSSGTGEIGSEYTFTGSDATLSTNEWFAICTVSDDRVLTKLKGRKDSVGLTIEGTNKVKLKIR